jgi:hypothetical protein
MALESINILKREGRHIAIEKQNQMDDLAYTTTSISFPKAMSENGFESYRKYGRETWTKTYKSFVKFKPNNNKAMRQNNRLKVKKLQNKPNVLKTL